MSFKPFENLNLVQNYYDRAAKGSRAAFVALESALKALELPECDTIQLKNIALTDAVKALDDGTIIIYGASPDYALICNGTPGASGSAAPLDITEHFFFDLHFSMRFDVIPTAIKYCYRRKNESDATRWAFGYDPDQGFFVALGTSIYYDPIGTTPFDASRMVGQWFDAGFALDLDGALLHFYINGSASGTQAMTISNIPAASSETIDVGCAGVSIRQCAVISSGFAPMAKPETIFGRFPPTRPPYALNFYNFTPDTGDLSSIPDLSLNAMYNTPLTINTDNASITEIEVV